MSDESFGKKYEEEFEKIVRENPRPIILVSGATGAGKSSLINLVLGRNLAPVGIGIPNTQEFISYDNEMVFFWDSKGYEHGEKAQSEFFSELESFIEKQQFSPKTAVNIVWYCITAPGARILDVDKECLLFFKKENIPAALVFTQVDCVSQEQLEAMKKEAEAISGNLPMFLTSTDPAAKDVVKPGLDALYDWSLANMEHTRRTAFRAACNRNLSEKRREGHRIAAQHAASAFGVGFSPIPVSDAPLLLANQMGMIARLSYVWGIDLKTYLAAGGVLEMAMTSLGKTAAGNLLKWIPGLGTAVGGMINAIVGATLTYGLGAAINESCYKICELEVRGEKIPYADFFSYDVLIELIKRFMAQYKPQEGGKENASK